MNITTQDIASATATGQSGQSIVTGTPTANSAVSAGCSSNNAAMINISGTWTGTLQFEATSNGGETWNPVDALVKGVAAVIQSCTGNGSFLINTAGNQIVRARATGAMTGSAVVNITEQNEIDFIHALTQGATPARTSAAFSSSNTITETKITLAPGVSQQIVASNANRKLLRWMNTGINPMTVSVAASAVVGTGMNYGPASSTSDQGGSEDFDGTNVPSNQFAAISTGGTTLTVWEA